MTGTARLADTIREALRRFHLTHIPHRLTVVVALHPADLNSLLAHACDAEEPVYVTDGVAWYGHHQVLPCASVHPGRVRILVDAADV